MESVTRHPFELGKRYTRAEIGAAIGGGARAAFPTRGGRVLGICVAEEYNPRAPAELIAGPSGSHLRAARALAASGGAVPVFVRRRGSGWEFQGRLRVASLVDDPAQVGARAAEAARAGGAVLVLFEAAPKDREGAVAPEAV